MLERPKPIFRMTWEDFKRFVFFPVEGERPAALPGVNAAPQAPIRERVRSGH